MSYITRHPRRTVAALATALAATGVAVGSGATFTSSTTNPATLATAGTLVQTNSKSGAAVVAPPNMKPGDAETGQVTVTNSGSLPAKMTLNVSGVQDGFSAGAMTMAIRQGTTTLYSGNAGGVASAYDLGTWSAGESRTYEVSFALASAAGNGDQGKKAGASLAFDGVQE